MIQDSLIEEKIAAVAANPWPWIKVGNGEHTLIQPVRGGPWSCTICHKSWASKPYHIKHSQHTVRVVCPGVPIYEWGAAPSHLKRPKELKALGLIETGDPEGCIMSSTSLYYLWDERKAKPRPPKGTKR